PAKDALLSGRVDRIEKDQLGRFIIIDLKTGKHKPSKADLEKHPQLASYQVALEAGAGELMAAALQAELAGASQDGAAQLGAESGGAPSNAGDQAKSQRQTLEFTGLKELSGGALLLQIGDGTKSYGEQTQEPLSAESSWAVELINRAAELIAGEQLQARHAGGGAYGITCSLPDICPLCSRGRQVTTRSAL
ncbi:MAG: PD-(D/E)XK nuclease family protein, partial [Rothia sp. (in: high G+C Gram-positive bacteria)]|nr:PD-(D/E)XK nuclease family protein [Rothia sp. (in: high G+C Gram-positive bacteria)]